MKQDEWELKIATMLVTKGIPPRDEDGELIPIARDTAQMCAEADRVWDIYMKSGGNPVISHTNKGGATNLERNPLLLTWLALKKQALDNWRELCLTPKSFKQVMESSDAGNPLVEALLKIEG